MLENRPPDTNIVLVNVGYLGRDSIAEQINIISRYKPKVIGVGLYFNVKKQEKVDSILEESLKNSGKIVLISIGIAYKDKTVHWKLRKSIERFSRHAQTGFTNCIIDENNFRCVRSFLYNLEIDADKTELYFSAVLAREYDSLKTNDYFRRNGKYRIFYSGGKKSFKIIEIYELFKQKDKLDYIKDKIVILGILGYPSSEYSSSREDCYYSPFNVENYIERTSPNMPGSIIDANIISMILNDYYILDIEGSSIIYQILVYIIIYCLFLFFDFIFRRKRDYYDIASKLTSLILIIILIVGAVYIFAKFLIRIEVAPLLVVLILGPDFYEIYTNNIRSWASKLFKLILATAYFIFNKR